SPVCMNSPPTDLSLSLLPFFLFSSCYSSTTSSILFTLSLHDALPILYCTPCESFFTESQLVDGKCPDCGRPCQPAKEEAYFFKIDRKSTRLNSSHVSISYAVFCLKKKNNCNVLTNDSILKLKRKNADK